MGTPLIDTFSFGYGGDVMQFMSDDVIALFEFEESEAGLAISAEKHYKLVPYEEVTAADLEKYRSRTDD